MGRRRPSQRRGADRVAGAGRGSPARPRGVRGALLEADVNLKVVDGFVERVKAQAVGTETLKGVTPAQHFVGIVQAELEALLGGRPPRIAWSDRGPTVIMLVGLQGTGKTTT